MEEKKNMCKYLCWIELPTFVNLIWQLLLFACMSTRLWSVCITRFVQINPNIDHFFRFTQHFFKSHSPDTSLFFSMSCVWVCFLFRLYSCTQLSCESSGKKRLIAIRTGLQWQKEEKINKCSQQEEE